MLQSSAKFYLSNILYYIIQINLKFSANEKAKAESQLGSFRQ